MKKLSIIIIMILILCGCNNTKKPKNITDNKPKQQEEQKSEQNEYVPTQTRLASFKTTINDNSKNRITNISICIKALNGLVIEPNGIFSFNKTVGPRTKERGYKKAKVMVDGKYVKDYGGGVCQVSTTIYNSANIAGLEILERHSHDKPVNYVSQGKDAAVNYDNLDLKIRNNTDGNIRFDITQGKREIFVDIVHIK